MKKSHWRRPLTWIILIFALLVLWVASWFTPSAWSSPEIRGYVATSDGQPVVGANVVVTWEAVAYWSNSGIGTLNAAEAVTDINGGYWIPAWRGKYIDGGTMQGNQPTTRVFKDGFVPLVVPNPREDVMALASPQVKYGLEGKTLTLEPFSGTSDAYKAVLEPFMFGTYTLARLNPGDDCVFRKIPLMLRSLEQVRIAMEPPGSEPRLIEAPRC